VLYLADGASVRRFAAVLEPGVVAGTTPAAVLVGVHSSVGPPADDPRMREYLPGLDSRRYDAHERFFLDEVARWAQREVGVSADRELRAVGGCSNGAVLASALGCRHPDRFGGVVAFSLGVHPPLPSGPGRRGTTSSRARWSPGSTGRPVGGEPGCASAAWTWSCGSASRPRRADVG
jgi:enterochelin esterase-like enzyme